MTLEQLKKRITAMETMNRPAAGTEDKLIYRLEFRRTDIKKHMSISESIKQLEKYFSMEYPIPEDMKEEWDDVLKWFEDTEKQGDIIL
jgi:hypothetical protein